MIRHLVCLLISILTIPAFAQQNTSEFTPLVAKGALPSFLNDDLQSFVAKKLNAPDLSTIDEKQQEIFLNLAHQRLVKRILLGDCIYGDQVSKYLEQLARQAFSTNLSTVKNLEYITVKSNEPFVRGVYPGVVFISTGLIAQTENEAQLTFWVLQGIAQVHLQMDQRLFLNDLKNRSNTFDLIDDLGQKEELSADSLAFEYFKKTELFGNEAYNAFLARIYSNIPFEDEPITNAYFNSNLLYVPEQALSTKNYPVLGLEKALSNSQKLLIERRNLIDLKLNNYIGTKSNLLIGSFFQEIRQICRLDLIKSSMLEGEYVLGLYQLFLLEKSFPNSIYLNQLKAYAWYNILSICKKGKIKYLKFSLNDCQGEICHLFHLLSSKNHLEIQTLALRNIYDIHTAFPNNKFIHTIYAKTLTSLAGNNKFVLTDYFSKSYFELDSIFKANPAENLPEKNSKYDKIASRKNNQGPDAINYYLYAISDIIKDNEFIEQFDKARDSIKLMHPEYDESVLTPQDKVYLEKQKMKIQNNPNRFHIDTLLIVNPTLFIRQPYTVSTDKRVQYENDLIDNLSSNASKAKIVFEQLTLEKIRKSGTDEFNKMMVFNALGTSIKQSIGLNGVVLDYTYFEPILYKEKQEILLFPILFVNADGSIHLRLILFDLKNGGIIYDKTEIFRGKPSKNHYNMILNSFFKRVKG